MDLRPYAPNETDLAVLMQHCGYQPFIFTDDRQSGEGYYWVTGRPIRVMDRARASAREWRQFVEANARMRAMYEGWIAALVETEALKPGASVLDIAANAGYFLYRLLQLGAGEARGFDVVDNSPAYAVLNRLLGVKAEFALDPYDQWTHRTASAKPADLVISSAFMCHLSDPLYHLAFVGGLAKRALFLFSAIDRRRGFRITFDGAKRWGQAPFPICFDQMTHVSRGLVDFGLRELGFARIIELRWRRDWIPWSLYRHGQAIIALR
jgi:SAM-dependent methyltransferase